MTRKINLKQILAKNINAKYEFRLDLNADRVVMNALLSQIEQSFTHYNGARGTNLRPLSSTDYDTLSLSSNSSSIYSIGSLK